MSNEHDDDEIRESIPCVSFAMHEDGSAITVCLPVGYSLDSEGGVFHRGQRVSDDGGERRAWADAIAREKARRAREGKPSTEDNAAAMLAEVIRERDELRAKLERVRGLQRWKLEPVIGFLGEVMVKDEDGGYVRHADLAAIIGKDGEA